MLDTERDRQWSSILSLTQKMLSAAYESEWDSLISYEAQRSKLLSIFFENKPLPAESEVLRKGITKTMAADKEIYRLSAAAHVQIGGKLNKLANHKSATSAYLKNTG